MRILERGTLPGDRLITARCDQCLSKLEFARKEAVIEPSGTVGILVAKVGCPVCNNTISHEFKRPEPFKLAVEEPAQR